MLQGQPSKWQSWGESPGLSNSTPRHLFSPLASGWVERVRVSLCPKWVLPPGSCRIHTGVYVGVRKVCLCSAHSVGEEPPGHAPYLQQCGRPGTVSKVLDNGDVASQAPVHAAALVTHQHTPADGGPARVCRVGGKDQPKPDSGETL